MTVVQPMLSLWDDDETVTAPPRPVPRAAHEDRVLADSSDRIAWLRARSQGITATDVARLSSPRAVQAVVLDKLYGNGFGGNAYTDHGRAREPEIARWVLDEHGIAPSSRLFHAAQQRRHLATPDGVVVRDDGRVELCEIKTTKKAWSSIPRTYLRQVFWQQYVLGAERTLVVWEQHLDFVPVDDVPCADGSIATTTRSTDSSTSPIACSTPSPGRLPSTPSHPDGGPTCRRPTTRCTDSAAGHGGRPPPPDLDAEPAPGRRRDSLRASDTDETRPTHVRSLLVATTRLLCTAHHQSRGER
nr:hypothetical protein GCM10025699_44870 [Microbacterium flavescens]